MRRAPAPGPPRTPPCTRPGRPSSRRGTAPPRRAAPSSASSSAPRSPSRRPPTPTPHGCGTGLARCAVPGAFRVRAIRAGGDAPHRSDAGPGLGGGASLRDAPLRERDELAGVAAERAVTPRPLWSRRAARARRRPYRPRLCPRRLRLPGSRRRPSLLGARHRRLLYQANVTLTWSRAVQRVVGNLVGVLLFAAVTPVAQLGPLALVLCILACNFGAEALIGRNYWLGSVCVTPWRCSSPSCPATSPPVSW